MTSRTRTTCPLNQRGAAGGYEKMPPIRPIPWVDHYLANEVLVDDFSPPYGNWSPPPAGSRLQLVDDPIPYLSAPEPPTPSTPPGTPSTSPAMWNPPPMPPPAHLPLAMVDDPVPYLIAPTPPTPPSPSTSAETPPSADPDRPA